MSKVIKVITDIRDTLNDPDGDRWTNTRLIRAINEGIRDINKRAKILRGKSYFNIQGGVSLYKLEANIQIVTRCVYNNKSVAFKSHTEMDELSDTWEEDIGDELQYIVYDKLNRGEIRLYPTPTSTIGDSLPAFGVITNLDSFEFNQPYGIITNFVDIVDGLVIYYIKKPDLVEVLNDDLPLDDTWDKAIKHYVCGVTLRDDTDVQNRQFGNEEIQLYGMELQIASKDSSNNFTEAGQYETNYRRL